MEQRLECRHTVDVRVGLRLWCYYDLSFGVVTAVGHEQDPWHDFVMDGSPYKAAGSHGYFNAARLACQDCGLRDITRNRAPAALSYSVDADTWVVIER